MTQAPDDTWQGIAAAGAVHTGGSSVRNLTGSWRTRRPVIDFDLCSHCMICWVLCPDNCFETSEGRLLAVSLDHCKGCGICASECPRHCIEMVAETREE